MPLLLKPRIPLLRLDADDFSMCFLCLLEHDGPSLVEIDTGKSWPPALRTARGL